jgi:hypothetical protein
MTLPKPKTGEIADLLNAELHKPRSDELTLKRLEREIGSMFRSPDSDIRTEALVLSGALAALRFDIPLARQSYENALAASGYSPHIYYNYAATLLSMGLPDEALAVIEKGCEKAPGEAGMLTLAVEAAGAAIDLEKLEGFGNRLAALQLPEMDPGVRDALEGANWQRSLLESPGVTREELLKRYKCARRISHEHRLRIPEERASSSTRGTLIEWAVDCGATEIAQMNLEAALALADLPPDPCEPLIAFGYTSAQAVRKSRNEAVTA